MKPKNRLSDLESLLAKGEMGGVDGFRSETANGSARWKGTGWNQQYNYSTPEAPEKPTWRGGRSNRTGE
jgi:hypothetical protein